MSVVSGFKGFLGGIAATAKLVKKGQAIVDALDDDTDGDGFPQYENLKQRFATCAAKGKELAVELKGLALLAYDYFQHILAASE